MSENINVVLPSNFDANTKSSVNTKLISLAQLYMKELQEGNEVDTQDAFELLMETVYGEGVWKHINNL